MRETPADRSWWLFGDHWGSAFEVFLFTSLGPMSFFLRTAVLCRFSTCGQYLWRRFLIDYVCLVLPTVLCSSVLSGHIPGVLLIMFIASWLMVIDACGIQAVTASSLHTKRHDKSQLHYDTVSFFKAYVLLATSACILAVDLPIFPDRFAKTESFGYSLMDVGVGMVVFGGGLGAAGVQRRERKRLQMLKLLRLFIILCGLGIARLVVVTLLNYHVDEKEYGRHWNFFFTLAFTTLIGKRISSLHLAWMNLTAALVVMVVYEFCLHKLHLQAYILTAPSEREFGVISLNREGIFSLLGTTAIYMAGSFVGECLSRSGRKGRTYTFLLVLFSCLLVFCSELGIQPSRRMANFGYFSWMCFLSVIGLLMIHVVLLFRFQIESFKPGVEGIVYSMSLFHRIHLSGLSHFLISNLLTGLCNFMVIPKALSPAASVLIMIGYSLATSVTSTVESFLSS